MDLMLPIPLAVISREMLGIIVLVPMTLVVGFALGLIYERWYHASALQRTSKRFEKLFAHVSGCLDQAERACQMLQKRAVTQPLNVKQQSQLQNTCGKLSKHVQQLNVAKIVEKKTRPFRQPKWSQSPTDDRTGLPDFSAYQQNLIALAKALEKTSAEAGAIFIKIDHYDRHVKQYGINAANEFVKQTASLVVRQLRNEDVLCQATDDVLIGLLPDLTSTQMTGLADQIRTSVSNKVFSHPETNEQVFVTVTFGCTSFSAADARLEHFEDLLWERSQLTFRTTQRHGRWQLRQVSPDGSVKLIAG
ncbi:MAG TPA: hypothetical protein DD473_05175 [Planctomycetaceae bacterium]|nr:hypothetical protein [Planctomycetaceae bacterium]|tara:strand:+ start:422 stop:1336 length:915 start_codon:yes stop_codon:yes gene_type:complete